MRKKTGDCSRSGYEVHVGRPSHGSEAPSGRGKTPEEVDMHEVLCHAQGQKEAPGMPEVWLQKLQAQDRREASRRVIGSLSHFPGHRGYERLTSDIRVSRAV